MLDRCISVKQGKADIKFISGSVFFTQKIENLSHHNNVAHRFIDRCDRYGSDCKRLTKHILGHGYIKDRVSDLTNSVCDLGNRNSTVDRSHARQHLLCGSFCFGILRVLLCLLHPLILHFRARRIPLHIPKLRFNRSLILKRIIITHFLNGDLNFHSVFLPNDILHQARGLGIIDQLHTALGKWDLD